MKGAETVFLYDGECGFCNKSVNFLLDHSDADRLCFAAIQSDYGEKIFRAYGMTPNLKSSYLCHNGKLFGDSSAVLRAFSLCRFPVRLMAVCLLVPAFLRNPVYGVIAKNRHKISKSLINHCRIPSAEERKRFRE